MKEKTNAAFFDVDGTILRMNSMIDFFFYWTERNNLTALRSEFHDEFEKSKKNDMSREEKNKKYYRLFRGFSEREIINEGLSWCNQAIENKNVFIEPVWDALYASKRKGLKIVFVSGSMLPLLSPIAKIVGADDILCTKLISDKYGILTGNIGVPQTIGEGKKQAMTTYANDNGLNLGECYSYGDDTSDIPMLECVGHPVCVGSETALACYASNKGWEILSI
ncbi:HAD family hydrolase [Serratia sp. (in: enterobacteria)]|uniref:HAD family hydrolase n=1 Tax=Serratia sp. (in: enterobacteria) TaxID=616 RepID=UPI00398975F4